jgi:hypothetical protein
MLYVLLTFVLSRWHTIISALFRCTVFIRTWYFVVINGIYSRSRSSRVRIFKKILAVRHKFPAIIFLEKKKIFYGTRKLSTMITTSRHWSLSWLSSDNYQLLRNVSAPWTQISRQYIRNLHLTTVSVSLEQSSWANCSHFAVKKLPAFYGTSRLITICARSHHWPLS